MEPEAIDSKGGPELVTFREAARRVVEEGIAPSMSHQRISQLAKDDRDFPPVQKVGRSNVVDWTVAKTYFLAHAQRAASRDSRRRNAKAEGHGGAPDKT
ncbi:hypothetical protein BV881_31870 [Streptomyces sp. ZL-24]|uniref:hypothetical protein n=1 Tax=Streptomyces sp. ZL-24 TaxID=1933029 RepID=UPI000D464825|nr:hypothetical protein [Streptomyces sp. ZL-24]POG43449.1 hypothetical protein BV881_31870 [Streptomyces sp. ZL-24]